MVRVLLLDNDASTRAVLRLRLSLEPDLKVVGDAADRDTVLALAEELVPDVVVMDVKDPGLDGTAAATMLRQRCPACVVVVLLLHDTKAARIHAQGVGVTVVGKHEGDERLLDAIRSAASPA